MTDLFTLDRALTGLGTILLLAAIWLVWKGFLAWARKGYIPKAELAKFEADLRKAVGPSTIPALERAELLYKEFTTLSNGVAKNATLLGSIHGTPVSPSIQAIIAFLEKIEAGALGGLNGLIVACPDLRPQLDGHTSLYDPHVTATLISQLTEMSAFAMEVQRLEKKLDIRDKAAADLDEAAQKAYMAAVTASERTIGMAETSTMAGNKVEALTKATIKGGAALTAAEEEITALKAERQKNNEALLAAFLRPPKGADPRNPQGGQPAQPPRPAPATTTDEDEGPEPAPVYADDGRHGGRGNRRDRRDRRPNWRDRDDERESE